MTLRNIMTVCFIYCVLNGVGQEREFKIEGALGYAQGFITENTRTQQFQGFIGGSYKKFDVRLDGFYYIGATGNRPRFLKNDQLYIGLFYHFLEGNIKPYVGFQTGISYSQASEYGVYDNSTGKMTYEHKINPVQSFALGAKYKGEKPYFVFFETRYIVGRHTAEVYPVYLDELRFSLGIGIIL